MHPSPLPPHLRGTPFRVREAGLSPRRLRALDLDRSVWGVRAASPAIDLPSRCRLVTTRLRSDAVVSHVTAAMLHGMPVPWPSARDPHIHIAVPAPEPAPHARGLIGHSLSLTEADITTAHGIRCTSPERTWCDLGSRLELGDLVAAGDHLIHRRLPLSTRAKLTYRMRRLGPVRGIRTLRAALPLLDDRTESPQESRLRVLLHLAGLPTPRINHAIVETETGWTSRPDFSFPDVQLVIEYQGDYHRTRAQWRKDMTRRSRLEAGGWYVMELNADDLKDPAELAERIQSVLKLLAARAR